MKIAITGGTGFVGRHLARALAAAGHDVVLVARGGDRRDETIRTSPRVTFFGVDLSDPGPLSEVFAHCAGINR